MRLKRVGYVSAAAIVVLLTEATYTSIQLLRDYFVVNRRSLPNSGAAAILR